MRHSVEPSIHQFRFRPGTHLPVATAIPVWAGRELVSAVCSNNTSKLYSSVAGTIASAGSSVTMNRLACECLMGLAFLGAGSAAGQTPRHPADLGKLSHSLETVVAKVS